MAADRDSTRASGATLPGALAAERHAADRPARWSRRAVLGALPAAVIAGPALAQAAGIRLLRLNGFEIRVSDVTASLQFYQSLFGMPVQARSSDRFSLRIGEGPQFMAIRAARDGETPAITQVGYAVADFDAMRTQAALTRVGFERIDAPPITDAGVAHRMKTWLRPRGDTEELFFADDNGLIVQLSGLSYCGVDGEACDAPVPERAGMIPLSDINHFTVFLGNGAAANRFYQQSFGLEVQAYQGPQAPVTGIGDGRQFVMYVGGGEAGSVPANIHHASFNMAFFDVERVLALLSSYGLSARGERPLGPLMHYVSLRMPNRGGAEGGTPELYFTDPDGILMQIQDETYCGGGGYLGNQCL